MNYWNVYENQAYEALKVVQDLRIFVVFIFLFAFLRKSIFFSRYDLNGKKEKKVRGPGATVANAVISFFIIIFPGLVTFMDLYIGFTYYGLSQSLRSLLIGYGLFEAIMCVVEWKIISIEEVDIKYRAIIATLLIMYLVMTVSVVSVTLNH